MLEVGCGAGRIAAALSDRGHRLAALDLDRKAVDRARARGVDARQADFVSASQPGLYDAVLFSRSLHHIQDLSLALDRARALLAPRGLLVLDEFDYRHADAATAEWFFARQREIGTGGENQPGDSVASWRAPFELHEPPVHAFHRILAAVESRFASVEWLRVPYLSRMLTDELETATEALADELERRERRAITAGEIRPLGARLSAVRPG